MEALQEQKKAVPVTELEVSYNEEKGIKTEFFGCEHYRKGCLVRAECCKKWYPCRLCHDDEEITHEIDRHVMKYMLCMHCMKNPDVEAKPQPIAQTCATCSEQMATYFCNICKFFDDYPGRDIYHCADCGICRRGKKENFFHCKTCKCCYTQEMKTEHKCLENILESDCPICHEYMFTSTQPVHFLHCGHAIHVSCLHQYLDANFTTCPICKKSVDSMPFRDQQIDDYLRCNPMPDEFRHFIATVFCNDCLKYSDAPFHFAYHKCGECQSYNTVFQSKRLPEIDPGAKDEKDVDSVETDAKNDIASSTQASPDASADQTNNDEKQDSTAGNGNDAGDVDDNGIGNEDSTLDQDNGTEAVAANNNEIDIGLGRAAEQ